MGLSAERKRKSRYAAHVFFTGVENVHNIYRKIEAGDVWKRDPQGRFASDTTDEKNYSLNLDVDLDRMVSVVDLTNSIDKEQMNNASLLSFVKNLASNKTTFSDVDSKAIISVLPKDARHITYSSQHNLFPREQRTHTFSIYNIRDVIAHSVLIESVPNKKGTKKATVKSYHRFYTPVKVQNKIYTIRIVVEEQNGVITVNPTAINLYDVIVEINKNKNRPPLQSLNDRTRRDNGSSVISIREMLTGVKDYDGAPYYSVRPERVSKVDDIQAGMKQPQDNKGKKPHITVEEKVRTDSQKFGMLDTVLHSPSYVAEKYARFRGFFRLGAKAMDKQEYLRNKFDRHLKRMLDPLQTKEEKKLWNTILYYR